MNNSRINSYQQKPINPLGWSKQIFFTSYMIYFKFNSKQGVRKPSSHKVKRSIWKRLAYRLIKPLIANPDFEDEIGFVSQWYIEYNEEIDCSSREIGLDVKNNIIVRMPDERNYGFWLDTNCTIEYFKKRKGFQMISKQDFEDLWKLGLYISD